MSLWEKLPEMRMLGRIAAGARIGFILRGSTAQRLVEADERDEHLESLLSAVPPFSDIDFLVENGGDRRALASGLAAEMPESRFFRVEIRTFDELERYEQSSLAIEGQPWIRFGSGENFNDSLVIQCTAEEMSCDWKPREPAPIVRVRSEFLHSPDILTDL